MICEMIGCDTHAAWIVKRHDRPDKFMCQWHFDQFTNPRRIPGLDPPLGASDEWRPSIIEMVRQADMEIRRQDRLRRRT